MGLLNCSGADNNTAEVIRQHRLAVTGEVFNFVRKFGRAALAGRIWT
jgi:hypothetical protein